MSDERDEETKEFLRKVAALFGGHWGPRCPEREPGCPCCEAWALYDLLDAMTV